ncbi:NAD-dependent epimerase/dehydratase family protein [Desulfuromonas acetexigens]|uniref:NAD-dependent epimerase/dehydratase family protein n=1 Tax=Trichloromonas acetexigens TaxID=38815 RepID=A0A550JKN8_9BACT|nr:NAD-dependent epimerase/dehydratase family protein [Desulfuromonas acetexigens]TRO83786.1 NAD-dependent epimerase/dehydratase family protein [Desulfuromonas acetexigens]
MKALVTGGGGFLGLAIVRLLRQRGDEVRSLARNLYPELDALGVEQLRGDLADARTVAEAAAGCDLVFHVAAKAGVWGDYQDYHQANVVGTVNVIAACRAHGIDRLVYTSSPSVVFDGKDMEGVDESVPYPAHFEAHYPRTKAEAEKLVLAANGPNLATTALRPHLIWGPGDNHLVPRILDRGRRGRLRRIGKRPCLVDTLYIDNAATAHLQAADALAVGSIVAGKAYFLAQGEPKPVWEVVDRILAAGGLPPVTRVISPQLAYAAGWLLEKTYTLLRLSGEPPMTRFVARELSTAHWFDLCTAHRDFGYQPRINFDEGMERLAAWLKEKPR